MMAHSYKRQNAYKAPNRYSVIAFGLALACASVLALGGCASSAAPANNPANYSNSSKSASQGFSKGQTYNENELVSAISTHLGVTSESAATAIERLFKDRGRPVGYITGEEGSGAVVFGARYGKGTLWMKDGRTQKVYWQGPSVGFDGGADVSKVFTLVYGLKDPQYIFQRFPGADGSAFLVAGMAIDYKRANGVTLAPVRSGIGFRLGANVGYTSYTRKRSLLPL